MTGFRSTLGKLVTVPEALEWRRGMTGKVVFTNGVFDLIHPGHVEYLEAARALGAGLIVAVNSDLSARQLGKGDDRPLVSAGDRVRVIAALAAVDRVVVFGDPTPAALIEELAPDILVKGGDYRREDIAGADSVEARGGEVVIMPLVPNHSTTVMVEKIRGAS